MRDVRVAANVVPGKQHECPILNSLVDGGVDLDEVWNEASNHLPQMREVLSSFLSQNSSAR